MIAKCKKCHHRYYWHNQSANAHEGLCPICYWCMEVGDMILCIQTGTLHSFPQKGATYIITAIQQRGGATCIRVNGSDCYWPLSWFLLSHKIGDTDLRTGF